MIDPFQSATRMLSALRIREISATELLEVHLARVSKLDERVGAVVIRDFDHARQKALQADNQIHAGHAGLLAGLPMTVKESMNVTGLHTTCGMEESRRFVSAHDGRNVERLRQAGAIIFGKTNVPIELSDWQSDNPIYGRTSNPYDRALTPGGSSGGSAAALAAGFTPLELGSDIAGSIRVPAAFCGVFGHRPSETALAKSGQWPMPPAVNPLALMGVQGPMARSAADLHLAMQVLAGPDIGEDTAWQLQLPASRHERLDAFRVAVMPVPDWVVIDPSIRAALERVTDGLVQLGVNVTEAQPPAMDDWHDHFMLYLKILGAMLCSRSPARVREARLARLDSAGDPISQAMAEGVRAGLPDLSAWLAEREQVRGHWREFFAAHDLLLAPACQGNAFAHHPFDSSALFAGCSETLPIAGHERPYLMNAFFASVSTLAGLPATAFPADQTVRGLPVGLQVIGPYLNDLTPIGFLCRLEEAGLIGFRAPPDLPAGALDMPQERRPG